MLNGVANEVCQELGDTTVVRGAPFPDRDGEPTELQGLRGDMGQRFWQPGRLSGLCGYFLAGCSR